MNLCGCFDLSESLPPPSGLDAVPVNESAVRLSWKQATSAVGQVTGYTVMYTALTSAVSNLSRLSLNDPSMSSVVRY